MTKIQEEMTSKLSKREGLKENKEKYEKELAEKQKQLEEINQTLSQKELEMEEDKYKLEQNTDKKYEIEVSNKEQRANITNFEKRILSLQNEIQNNISELDNAKFTKEEIEKGFYEIQSNKNGLTKELEKIREEKTKAEKQIKEIDTKMNYAIQELNFKESKHKFLIETEKEKEGYQKSVKTLLKDCKTTKELGKGVKGALAELIDVPAKLETAIEMALGAGLQNIVIEKEEDAKRLIEYLRQNNLGRATFLPISAIQGKKLEKLKGNFPGILGIASDLIQYDKQYAQIILNLLGKTVIVENMETAIQLAKENGYTFRIVTLDGDMINTTGSMSGGSVNKKTVKILGRKKEIEELAKQIEKIKKTQEELKQKREKILTSSSQILKKAEELENSLQTIEIKYNVENQKRNSINENIEKIAKRLEKVRNEKKEAEEQKQECFIKIEENNKKKEQIDEESNFLREKMNEFSNLNKDTLKKVDDLNLDITNLKISVSSFTESESSLDEMANLLKEEIENQNKNIENKRKQIKQMTLEQKELEEKIKIATSRIEELKEKVSRSDKDIGNLKEQRQKANEKLSQKEQEEVEEFKIIEDLKAQMIKLDVKKSKIDDDLNEVITTLWNEYELTPNNAEGYEKPANVAITTRRVNNLRQDIKELRFCQYRFYRRI